MRPTLPPPTEPPPVPPRPTPQGPWPSPPAPSRPSTPPLRRPPVARRAALAALCALAPLAAATAGPPVVHPGFEAGGSLRRTESFELLVEAPPAAGEGRIAVLLGSADVTDLFRRSERGLVYRADVMPLPSGRTELAVYLVSPGNRWQEIGRFPLHVLTRGGFESAEVSPRLDLETRGRLDGSDSAGERGFDEVTGRLGLETALVRGAGGLRSRFDVVGVTAVERALRFGERGDDAPRADLASYQVALYRGRARFELGHVSFGDSRQLVSSFSSRGVAVELPLARFGDLGVAVTNGSSIVGWDNPLGLESGDHQVRSGRVGLELRPGRPGALRLDGTVIDASLLPLDDFAQASVNDRETSDGWSLRLSGLALGERLRFDGGYAESSFDNPADPLLSQGAELVPVARERRSARYLDLDLDLLRDRGAGEGLPAELTLGLRHERVEPLYRSVGTSLQADVERNVFELNGRLGPVLARAAYSEAEDNLDRIPSILTTETRHQSASLTVPLGELGRRERGGAWWWPLLSYGLDRTHQRGTGVPENGGFNASHVPDQVSLAHRGELQWQGDRWRFGYSLATSDQDNRQPGREAADFATRVHGLRLGLAPGARVDVDLDWSLERTADRERDEIDRTRRYGLAVDTRPTDWLTLSTSASHSEGENAPRTRETRDTVVDAQCAVRLDWRPRERHGVAAQLFLRYAYQQSRSRDLVFGVDDESSFWSLSSGVSLSLD